MTLKDLIITPIFLLMILMLAYWIRPFVTNSETRKYFIPGLLVKLVGAILVGIIYQFYYTSGDTFTYFEHGSRWIWEALMDDPNIGFKLLSETGGERQPETFDYSQNIWYYKDVRSYLIVRITAVIDILTFHTYSSTALFFALFSFSGLWAFYIALTNKYVRNSNHLALAILFVPSMVFWGSGILKDTITFGAIGWLTFALLNLIEFKKSQLVFWMIALFSSILIFKVKSYILICYFPTVSVWLYWKYLLRIRRTVLKLLVAPILVTVFGLVGFYMLKFTADSTGTYALDNIAERAAITAYDIRYGWGARTGGDGGYDIGLPDGTISGTLKLLPAAINVSLFRPYLWEVKNPLMLLSALESTLLLVLTVWVLFVKRGFGKITKDPFLIFCLTFSLLFAFAVGVSTFNFGTLMRYKIPMMPFFFIVLAISQNSKNE